MLETLTTDSTLSISDPQNRQHFVYFSAPRASSSIHADLRIHVGICAENIPGGAVAERMQYAIGT